MKHFVYSIAFDQPAPAGGGKAEDWFKAFKWNVEGELFLPVRGEDGEVAKKIEPDDRVWIVVSERPEDRTWPKGGHDDWYIFGYVTVLRMDESPLSFAHIAEIRYDGAGCVEAPTSGLLRLHMLAEHLQISVADEFYARRWEEAFKEVAITT